MAVIAAFMVPHPPMLVPEIGRGSEKRVEATAAAYGRVAEEIAALKPETIVISSPHATMYGDYMHLSPGAGASGSFSQFGAPDVRFSETYDEELVRTVERLAGETGLAAGTLGERDRALDHGTMVPLFFLRRKYAGGKLVRIGLSGLPLCDHYALGQLVQRAAEELDRRVVFVASGDLSHKLQTYGPYGFDDEGPQYDERIMDVCARAAFGELFDFDETFCEKAAECGHRSFVIMAGALDGYAVEAKRLSHEDVTGVGYGVCSFYPAGEDPERRFLERYREKKSAETARRREEADPYVKLAYQSLESLLVKGERLAVPKGLPEELTEGRAGAFVSLHEHGKLRGCIGTIAPTRDCLAREIIDNAVSAAMHDTRFQPVEAHELPWLEISVDVLGRPEPVASPAELDAKKYGVIVTCGDRRGLLLPDLDGVDTPEEQISIARRKGGIGPGEKVTLQRFTVTRHF
ncbi:MAG: AmmeMemoRadiSam system protein A [Oscillospiraceae bacterium]|nr:AmmeMemoRadiSam system protein A [Oscillospiraceae bacterium]